MIELPSDDLDQDIDTILNELEKYEESFCEPGLNYGLWRDSRCACDHCIDLRNKIYQLMQNCKI